MKRRAVYPGTFDPVTYGHIDLIKRGVRIFDEVIVAVAQDTPKNTFFSTEDRVEFLKRATRSIRGVKIEAFDGLVVDFVKKRKSGVVIRGLRMVSDFEYEFQMALTNRKISKDIETIFMMPSESYSYISSKLIKEAALLGADVRCFVPDFVAKRLKR